MAGPAPSPSWTSSHSMEALDATLADSDFAALIADADVNRDDAGLVAFDVATDRSFVGSCGFLDAVGLVPGGWPRSTQGPAMSSGSSRVSATRHASSAPGSVDARTPQV